MNIVCGTDFSDHAKAGANVAAALAAKFQDRLLLVHALPGGSPGGSPAEAGSALSACGGEDLAEEGARLGQRGATVEPHRVAAPPDCAILSKLLPGQTRLVVVGSQGRLTSDRRLAGGVAERVAESAPIPTLVVRQDTPLVQWAHGERALRVLCAYDFTATADAALTWFNTLRGWGPCELVVAQVAWPPEHKARLGLSGPAPLDTQEPELQRILERELSEKAKAVLGDGGARIRVRGGWGRPDHDLLEIASEEHADLIVTGAHQRQGMERLFHVSVSRALLRHAPMNVLVVPATSERTSPPPAAPHRVLAATDFSDVGNQAVRHAYSLLGGGGTVRLLHVVHPGVVPNGASGRGVGDRQPDGRPAETVRQRADRLRALVPAEAAANGIVTEVEVIEHPRPAMAIAQAAERFGADVICLGTHGRSRLAVAIGDSVTHTVMRRSARPLLVVHAPPQ